jgi:tRNA(fMet)-specific endonuclease VapC
MLDTNAVSYILKGKSPAARARLAALDTTEAVRVSSIAAAELHYGVAKRNAAERLRNAIELFLLRMEVLPWGIEEAVVYGKLRSHQDSLGRRLGPLDTQIAAHARAVGGDARIPV